MTTTTSKPPATKDASSAAAPALTNASLARPTSSGRMPSLNQITARMSDKAANNSNTTGSNQNSTTAAAAAAARPRLPTSLLARSSSSVASSAGDSTAAQPPSTRSVSPTPSSQRSTSPTDSQRDAADGNAAAPENELAPDHIQRLSLSSVPSPNDHPADDGTVSVRPAGSKPARGYKNVPTLEAITERLRKTRALSIDGSEAPPPPAVDPATDKAAQKQKEHPLQRPWTLYHDTKAKAPFTPPVGDVNTYVPTSTETGAYEAGLTVIGEFDTVEEFCRYFNWLKPPSRLERNSNYHLFKSGIKPMWEDAANANGGKWVLTMKSQPQLLDRCWSWLAMALVGEELDDGDEICGAVVSLRSKVDRIQLWTRSKDDVERLNSLGRRLINLLDVSEADGIGLEFQYNTEERPSPSKFLTLQATFPQSGFRSTFSPNVVQQIGAAPSAAAAPPEGMGRGAGHFAAGGGGGAFGGNWRGRR